MSIIPSPDLTLVEQWLASKAQRPEIESQLRDMGIANELTQAYLDAYQKRLQARRQSRGFGCMVVGALMGFVSCMLTLINPVPALYDIILYGLTSIAVTIIVIGLYLVFES